MAPPRRPTSRQRLVNVLDDLWPYLAAGILLTAGLALSVAISLGAQRNADRATSARVAAIHEERVDTLRRQLDRTEVLVRSLAGDGDAAQRTPAEWTRLLSMLDRERLFPAVVAVEIAHLLRPDELAAYNASLNERWPGAVVHPVRGGRSEGERVVVHLIEPFAGNEAALGLDLLSEASRRDAVIRARDTGECALTTPLRLVQDKQAQPHVSVLMLMPLYDGPIPRTQEERRAAFRGVAVAILRVEKLVASLPHSLQDDLHIVDRSAAVPLMYDSDGVAAHAGSPSLTSALDVGGRRWEISSLAVHAGLKPLGGLVVPTLLGGIGFSVLFFGSVLRLTRGRRQALRLASQRAADLEVQERVFESVLDLIPDSVTKLDRDGRYTYVNPAGRSRSNAPIDDWLGRTGEELGLPRVMLDALEGARSRALATHEEQLVEIELPGEHGSTWIQARIVEDRSSASDAGSVLVVSRDVSALKAAQAARDTERRRIEGIVAAAMDALVTLDREHRIVLFNEAAERMFGRLANDVLGRRADEVLCRCLMKFAARDTDGAPAQEPPGQTRTVVTCDEPGPTAGTTYEVSTWYVPGDVSHITLACRDLTEQRKAAEKHEHVEQALRQAQKMEAVGQLTGGIAHDFNNLLTVILGDAELLLEGEQVSEPDRELLEELEQAAKRASELTRDLLAFSRRQTLRRVAIDPDELISTLLRMLRRVLGEDIELKVTPSATPLTIQGDRGMLEQVLMNLAINARHAMRAGGMLEIDVAEHALAADVAGRDASDPATRFVRIAFRDHGTGIAPDVLPHIFEPFFTTKEVGQGTGMGLATVYGIIEQHHGHISVESGVGTGTTFFIWLPLASGGGTDEQPHMASPRRRVTTATILHVEDEPKVRDVIRRMLERAGHTVVQCTTAAEALDVWSARRAEIQLVLTDVVMPGGMSGAQLARRLREMAPTLPIVFTTGYANQSGLEDLVAQGLPFFQKPCDSKSLLEGIEESLNRYKQS